MNYSTLKEAYSVDSFDKEKKKSKKSKAVRIEEFEDDASDISQRDVKNIERVSVQERQNIPIQEPSRPSEQERPKTLKGVQPHYDEELEKYLNINDFQSTNLNYYPQDYTQSYNNTNYSSPDTNNFHSGYEQEDRYQPKQLYQRPVTRTSYDATNDQYERPVRSQAPPTFIPIESQSAQVPHRRIQAQQVAQAPQYVQQIQHIPQQHVMKTPEKAVVEQKDTFYKNLINIGLFVFIGILIIFLCDQITEIAINIGMKRTMMLLEPYMNKEVRK